MKKNENHEWENVFIKPDPNQPMDRREFLRALGRYAILGGVLIAGAGLLKRTEQAGPEILDGNKNPNCRICPLLPSCTEPAALQVIKMNPKMLRDCKWNS
ncbi:MAG TPA: hypothetical protein VHY08_15450 [Bacillota bacterium]|nr:hypothetical protein [Bacillota bacterium]